MLFALAYANSVSGQLKFEYNLSSRVIVKLGFICISTTLSKSCYYAKVMFYKPIAMKLVLNCYGIYIVLSKEQLYQRIYKLLYHYDEVMFTRLSINNK